MHTRPLAELRSADEALFGGKSASLGELIAAGIPVPRASRSRQRSTTGRPRSTGESPADSDLDAEIGARRATSALRGRAYGARRVGACAPAPSARTAPRRPSPASRRPTCGCAAPTACATRCATAGRASTAPRRSATASAWATPATPAMGVTVQLMVDAEVSGVMFTCNPVSGDPSTVAVNASWGLGLAVVGGEVTPDEYRVSKVTGEVLHAHDRAKRGRVRADPAARADPRRRAAPSARRSPASTTRSWPRWSTSAGASSATSAATRTSSGRSPATASCSCSSRGR